MAADALRVRLAPVLTADPSVRVMDGEDHWRNGADPEDVPVPPSGGEFGSAMSEIRSIVVHLTAGWPANEKAEEFVGKFVKNPHPAVGTAEHHKWGVGTQFFIAGDMTVAQLIDLPRMTFHAEFVNSWSLGVETGNLGTTAPPSSPGERWRPLSGNANVNSDDVLGAKLWIARAAFRDVVVAWWTTSNYAGPLAKPLNDGMMMLFNEWHYRAWALLARYLAEQFEIPRNFPLLPYIERAQMLSGGDPGNQRGNRFRRTGFADERFPMLLRELRQHGVVEDDFFDDAAMQTRLDAPAAIESGVGNDFKRHSRIWRDMFSVYRGFHGHGYCGAISDRVNDHDCPERIFDWHRFAREVWDWWWYPYDFRRGSFDAIMTRRPYRRPDATTPLIEYYFEGQEISYLRAESTGPTRTTHGIFDALSSPSVFATVEGVPVYAPANGELVAARFPDAQDAVALGFVLTRHEVFHRPDTLQVELDGGVSFPANPGRIDYSQEPEYVYSLIMHLGRPDGLNLDEVKDENPDWLNRALIRKKECDLGVQFYDTTPEHGGYGARWDVRPPGAAGRLTLLEGWRTDQAALNTFFADLKAGRVAMASRGDSTTPQRILLGDYLGVTGALRRVGGTGDAQFGIAMEVFGFFIPPGFSSRNTTGGWPNDAGPRTAVFYPSEWAKTLTPQERDRLTGDGVNPDKVTWWPAVADWTQLHPTLPAAGRMNRNGLAFHLRPLEFMSWLNNVTWASEYAKFRITDSNNQPVPLAPNQQPRSRRF